MSFSIGLDMIDIPRIKKMAQNETFLTKIFTPKENELFNTKKNNKYQTIAGNFCGKEAFVKAAGTGFSGISPIEIEILRDVSGKPFITLYGRYEHFLDEHTVEISITHTDSSSAAVVLIYDKKYE